MNVEQMKAEKAMGGFQKEGLNNGKFASRILQSNINTELV